MHKLTHSTIAVLMACGSAVAAFSAAAAGPGPRGSLYQQEIAVCDRIQQDRAACLREAGAARQEAARGGLTSAPDYQQNALARCTRQPPADRADCEARVLGTGQSAVQGSVLGGGVIRETVTPILMPAPAIPAMPAPPAVAPAPVVVPVMPSPAPVPVR
ncbi:MAG: hypothetical protein EOP81_04850 [Variovorax sp.]|nr:MAG: hypothetical protein EOP81_04850 [Variovorax sp.]